MLKSNPYPNSWYVESYSECCGWLPRLDSVGNKSYSTGYLYALDAFYPHDGHRLINNKGEIAKVCQPNGVPKV